MPENNLEFNAQINSFKKEYPCFQERNNKKYSFLKGILDIPNDDGEIAGSFSIEIHPTKNFPYAFPILYEVGNDIPCEADWHKYSDNSCCLTIPAEEILICKRGITIVEFVSNIAIPYFANQLHKKHTGHYMHEYSHGGKGIQEFYAELFQSKDYNLWEQCIKVALGKIKYGRNEKCYCNSGKKYKKCHFLIEDDVRKIGKEQIMIDFKIMKLI